jgi:cytosine/adenosine deaminase-related metal-dependent hydrolase
MQDIGMLATFNNKEEEIPNGAIFIKRNVIEWVGRTEDLPKEYSTADEVLSMKNHLIMPGMVCYNSPSTH